MACARGCGSNRDECGVSRGGRRLSAGLEPGLGSLLHLARLAKRALGALIVSAPRCCYKCTHTHTHTHGAGLGEGTMMAEPCLGAQIALISQHCLTGTHGLMDTILF